MNKIIYIYYPAEITCKRRGTVHLHQSVSDSEISIFRLHVTRQYDPEDVEWLCACVSAHFTLDFCEKNPPLQYLMSQFPLLPLSFSFELSFSAQLGRNTIAENKKRRRKNDGINNPRSQSIDLGRAVPTDSSNSKSNIADEALWPHGGGDGRFEKGRKRNEEVESPVIKIGAPEMRHTSGKQWSRLQPHCCTIVTTVVRQHLLDLGRREWPVRSIKWHTRRKTALAHAQCKIGTNIIMISMFEGFWVEMHLLFLVIFWKQSPSWTSKFNL